MSNTNLSLLLIVVQGALIVIILGTGSQMAVFALFLASVAGLWFHRKRIVEIVKVIIEK